MRNLILLTLLVTLIAGCPHRTTAPAPASAVAPATAAPPAAAKPAPVIPVSTAELARALTADGEVTLRAVGFETGEATLHPDATEALLEVLTLLHANPQVRVEIGVHSDPRGSSAYNQKISAERAVAIVEWLAAQGIDAARLSPVGYGETQLLPCGDTPECYAQCRRIELIVVTSNR
jgi:outer membrane protein OmpA-like peptidoglycan-associated protein